MSDAGSNAGSNAGYCEGSGTGTGNGHGYGDGNGSRYGFGFGDGDGYGYGYGYGHGTIIATIAGYEVRRHTPFAVIAVGCETHTITHWREHWREIADEHNVDVSEKDVGRVFTKMRQSREIRR